MNSKDIEKEARKFSELYSVVNKLGEEVQLMFIFDFMKIAVICGVADKNFDDNELLVFMWFMAIIREDKQLISGLRIWNRQAKQESRVLVAKMIEKLPEENRYNLFTPSLFKEIDRKHGTNLFEPMTIVMNHFAQLIIKADGKVTEEEIQSLLMIGHLLHQEQGTQEKTEEKTEEIIPEQESLEEVLQRINILTGMQNVKSEINTLTNFLKVQQMRLQRGLSKTPLSLHSVFCGPPGTGKTTIARLIGKIYHSCPVKLTDFSYKGLIFKTIEEKIFFSI